MRQKILTIFSKQNPDKSWKVASGKTRIEIFTKNAGTLSEENLKKKLRVGTMKN